MAVPLVNSTFALFTLNKLFASHMLVDTVHFTVDEAVMRLVGTSSSGWPYNKLYGCTKAEVLKHLTGQQLFDDFVNYSVVIGCTLKDELRPLGKDARLFRPAPMQSIVAGYVLFGKQLDLLQALCRTTPYGIGLKTPGNDVSRLWTRLSRFLRHHCGDGDSWDARYPLWVCLVLCIWRKQFVSTEYHHLVDKYYSDLYNGVTNVMGNLVFIPGMASGQLLTSSDNSLGNVINVTLAVSQLGYDPFDQNNFQFSCVGDDVVIGTNYPFTSSQLRAQMEKNGFTMDFQDDDCTPFLECTYIGTKPVDLDGDVENGSFGHTYLRDKLIPSLAYGCQTSVESFEECKINYVKKCVSIATLFYYDPVACEAIRDFIFKLVPTLNLPSHVLSNLALETLLDHTLYMLYNVKESRLLISAPDLKFPMRKNILDRSIPMGSTDEGKAWCMKTLHPADVSVPIRSIPDGNSFPTVLMEYEAYARINPINGAVAGSWNTDINLLPHPVQPLTYSIIQPGQVSNGGAVYNPTLSPDSAGSTCEKLTNDWGDLCQSWRMVYTSCTLELDAPALANQGSIVAGQLPMASSVFNYSAPPLCYPHVFDFNYANNQCDFRSLVAKPAAYSGLAHDGCYMTLRMDPKSPWVNSRETMFITSGVYNQSRYFTLPTTTLPNGTTFPFFDALASPNAAIAVFGTPATLNGSQLQMLGQKNFGRMSLVNISTTASLFIRVRWGVEMMVSPNTILSPSVRPPSRMDEQAMSAYALIAGDMQDAYPASYNSFGKLGSVIKGIWNTVGPTITNALGLIPHPIAQGLSSGLGLIGKLTGAANVSRPQQRKKPKQRQRQPQQQRASQAPRKPLPALPPRRAPPR